MTQAVTYKGYTIQPAPRQLVDTGQWELNVFISWATEDAEDSRHFVKTGRYATEEEARPNALAYRLWYRPNLHGCCGRSAQDMETHLLQRAKGHHDKKTEAGSPDEIAHRISRTYVHLLFCLPSRVGRSPSEVQRISTTIRDLLV